jgi:hypothetical protein
MSEKTIIAEFKGGGKHICLSLELHHLNNVFYLKLYALEIKYSETYADESKRGKTIQRFDWCQKNHFQALIDDTIEQRASKLFMAWVEREVVTSKPKYYETWHNSLPSDEKLKYRSSPYDPCDIRFNNGN